VSKTNLKAVPQEPPHSPERMELAKACAARDKALNAVNKIKAAQEELWRQDLAAMGRVTAAESALKKAEADAPRLVTQRILGEKPDGDVLSVRDARAQLQSAEDDLEALRQAKQPLDAALKDAETELGYANTKVDHRVKAAIAVDSATLSLLERFAIVAPEFLGLRKTLEHLAITNSLPPQGEHWGRLADYRLGDDFLARWQRAIVALATDPDTQLPA
jgi:hypothetical protein